MYVAFYLSLDSKNVCIWDGLLKKFSSIYSSVKMYPLFIVVHPILRDHDLNRCQSSFPGNDSMQVSDRLTKWFFRKILKTLCKNWTLIVDLTIPEIIIWANLNLHNSKGRTSFTLSCQMDFKNIYKNTNNSLNLSAEVS